MCHTGRSWSSTLRAPNLPSSTRSWLITWRNRCDNWKSSRDFMGILYIIWKSHGIFTTAQPPGLPWFHSSTWDSIENPKHQEVMPARYMKLLAAGRSSATERAWPGILGLQNTMICVVNLLQYDFADIWFGIKNPARQNAPSRFILSASIHTVLSSKKQKCLHNSWIFHWCHECLAWCSRRSN